MEREFGIPSYIPGGGGELPLRNYHAGVVENPAAAATTIMGFDEAFLNGCFSEITLQSLLQPTPPASAMATLSSYSGGSSFSSPSDVHFQDYFAPPYGYSQQFSPTPPPWNSNHPYAGPYHRHQDIKIPKTERFDSDEDFAFQLLKNNNDVVVGTTSQVPTEPLINFFSTAEGGGGGGVFKTVVGGSVDSPELSMAFTPAPYQAGGAGYLSDIFGTTSTDQQQWSSQNRYMPYSKSPEASRHRRKKISEKISRLREVLPSCRKMDMGTVLEEAYNYVKFLEAQVLILQAMPPQRSINIPPPNLPPPVSNPSLDVISRRSYYTNVSNPNTLSLMMTSPPSGEISWGS